MHTILREDDPKSFKNTSANDEFQKLKSATSGIYENEVESNTICKESCGSSQLVVNLLDCEGTG